jgi:hypothetical protein
MNETSIMTAACERADEEILSYEVSDEALEAAAGTERGPSSQPFTAFQCCKIA